MLQRSWRSKAQSAPCSRWLLPVLLNKLPKPGNVCNRLLPWRRGQLPTLLQQAANLCKPQTCRSLLTGLLVPPPDKLFENWATVCSTR